MKIDINCREISRLLSIFVNISVTFYKYPIFDCISRLIFLEIVEGSIFFLQFTQSFHSKHYNTSALKRWRLKKLHVLYIRKLHNLTFST